MHGVTSFSVRGRARHYSRSQTLNSPGLARRQAGVAQIGRAALRGEMATKEEFMQLKKTVQDLRKTQLDILIKLEASAEPNLAVHAWYQAVLAAAAVRELRSNSRRAFAGPRGQSRKLGGRRGGRGT